MKYESPYSSASPAFETQQLSLKRRLSEMGTDFRENDEKRQRIEVPAMDDELDLASIIAQATRTAEQSFADSTMRITTYAQPDSMIQTSFTGQTGQVPDIELTAGLTSGFSSDPQLYMRILSLPMLESLVSSHVTQHLTTCSPEGC
jgi:hypothetical protein